MKKSVFALLAFLSFNTAANQVTAPIMNLFDAMRAHDGDKVLAQFTATARLQRAEKNGNVRTSDIGKFSESIAKATSYLDEHLLVMDVRQSGNLASVWTPYAFYRDSKLSHCGVNSFQLVYSTRGWKIQNLIDNSYPGDCQAFIAQYEAK